MSASAQNTTPSPVRLSDEADGVVVLTMDHPPANALGNALTRALKTTVEALAERADAPAVVLTGAGQRFFTAGGDLKEAVNCTAELMVERMTLFHGLLAAIERYPRPFACAVNGWCVGGGVELALFADTACASDTARFVFPEVDHGMLPAVKGIHRARRVLGDRAARRLLLGGEPVDAHEAGSLGIVDRVLAPGDLLPHAVAWARSAAAKPPAVFAALKRALRDTGDRPDARQLETTVSDMRLVFDDPQARAAREAWHG
jgi:enoyl-CoA hydratase